MSLTTNLPISILTVSCALSSILSFQSIGKTEFNLYGQGHLSYDNIDDGVTTQNELASSSSRLGLSLSHSLSDSLKVIMQLESGVDLTGEGENDGNGPTEPSDKYFTKTRPSYIGLEGDIGTILVGHWAGLDQWANYYNLFADQVGDLGNLWEASGIPGRVDDVVHYQSPQWNGMKLALTFAPDGGADNDDLTIAMLDYSKDKLKVAAVITEVGQGAFSSKAHQGTALIAAWHDERYSIGLGYQNEQNIQGNANSDRDSLALGASVNLGAKGKLKVQYAISDANANTVNGQSADAKQFAIGYDYQLNSDNVLYIAYANMQNDDNINFSVNGKGHGDKITPAFGDDMHAISVGIVSKFSLSLGPLLGFSGQ